MGHLYKLDFPNGKSYIGISFKNAQGRFDRHRKNATGNNSNDQHALYNAWRKYGEPKLTVLAVVENSLLHETEIKAIAVYKTKSPDGYNLTRGGEGVVGLMRSMESRAKMSAARKGGKFGKLSEEHRAKIGAFQRGKVVSEESRAKMSAASRGRVISLETRAKISLATRGHIVSPETRAKIGAANSIALKGRKGNPISPEQRAMISAVHLGKPLSEEHKAKLRHAWIARRAKQLALKTTQPTGELYAYDHSTN